MPGQRWQPGAPLLGAPLRRTSSTAPPPPPRVRVRVDSRNTFPDRLVCVRPPVSAEWLWYCVRLWSTSVDQSDSARGVSTPAIAGQASSAQAILRGQVLGTISEGCNTPRVPAHCCIPLRSLYSDISQCDFRRRTNCLSSAGRLIPRNRGDTFPQDS